ncbi:unnamed protein product, partial [Pleuronectes platessa]
MQMDKTGDRTADLQVGGRPLYPSATAALYLSSSPAAIIVYVTFDCWVSTPDTAEKLETPPPTPMEERVEEEGGIMGQEQKDEDKNDEQPASMTTQNSMTEKQENSLKVCPVVEEKGKEKGMKEGEMKKEMELEIEFDGELCQSLPGQPISFIRGADLFGYVGIEAVLDQMRRKTMKAGFEFNIMVVGQSGLGKSTLVNTLFKSKVSRKSCMPNYAEEISKTVKLHSVSH